MCNNNEPTKHQKDRSICSKVYFTISGIIFLVFLIWSICIHSPNILHIITNNLNSYIIPRFLWCLGWSCFGFSVLAYTIKDICPDSPYPKYKIYYPFMLLSISLLTLCILSMNEKTNQGWIFYSIVS